MLIARHYVAGRPALTACHQACSYHCLKITNWLGQLYLQTTGKMTSDRICVLHVFFAVLELKDYKQFIAAKKMHVMRNSP